MVGAESGVRFGGGIPPPPPMGVNPPPSDVLGKLPVVGFTGASVVNDLICGVEVLGVHSPAFCCFGVQVVVKFCCVFVEVLGVF